MKLSLENNTNTDLDETENIGTDINMNENNLDTIDKNQDISTSSCQTGLRQRKDV